MTMMRTVTSSSPVAHGASSAATTAETKGNLAAELAAANLQAMHALGTAAPVMADGFVTWLGQETLMDVQPWEKLSVLDQPASLASPMASDVAELSAETLPEGWMPSAWTLMSSAQAQTTATTDAASESDNALRAMEDFLRQLDDELKIDQKQVLAQEQAVQTETIYKEETPITEAGSFFPMVESGAWNLQASLEQRASVFPPSLGAVPIAFDPGQPQAALENVEWEAPSVEFANDLQESLREETADSQPATASQEQSSQGQSQEQGASETWTPELSAQDSMALPGSSETYAWKEVLEGAKLESMGPDSAAAIGPVSESSKAKAIGPNSSSAALTSQGSPVPGQIASVIQRMEQQGDQRWVIQLEPYELGRVDIAVEFRSDQRATVTMWVEKSHTLDTIRATESQLREQLEGMGSQMQFEFHSQQKAPDHGSLADRLQALESASDLEQPGWVAAERLLGIYA